MKEKQQCKTKSIVRGSNVKYRRIWSLLQSKVEITDREAARQLLLRLGPEKATTRKSQKLWQSINRISGQIYLTQTLWI